VLGFLTACLRARLDATLAPSLLASALHRPRQALDDHKRLPWLKYSGPSLERGV
jgi:hypothetical protein